MLTGKFGFDRHFRQLGKLRADGVGALRALKPVQSWEWDCLEKNDFDYDKPIGMARRPRPGLQYDHLGLDFRACEARP